MGVIEPFKEVFYIIQILGLLIPHGKTSNVIAVFHI